MLASLNCVHVIMTHSALYLTVFRVLYTRTSRHALPWYLVWFVFCVHRPCLPNIFVCSLLVSLFGHYSTENNYERCVLCNRIGGRALCHLDFCETSKTRSDAKDSCWENIKMLSAGVRKTGNAKTRGFFLSGFLGVFFLGGGGVGGAA